MVQKSRRSWMDGLAVALVVGVSVGWWAVGEGAAAFGARDAAAAMVGAEAAEAPQAVPTITAVTPWSGTIAGSTSVTITGTNLTGATAVSFGGTTVTPSNVTATSLVVTTPARAAGLADVVVTTPAGPSAAAKFFYDDLGITYVLPSWDLHNGPEAAYQAMANALRTRIPDGPRAKLGLSLFVSVRMNSYTVDTTSSAAIRAQMAETIAEIDTAIARSKSMTPPMPVGLSLLTAIRDRVDGVQSAAEAEDRRNVQWYGDNQASAVGWVTFSQYAKKMRRVQQAYLRELGTIIKERIIANPTVPIIVTGDGEVELTFARFTSLTGTNPAIGDYSPFAVTEFRDWIRGTGAYATGQPLAGQAYSNASRFTTDPSPATDGNGDGFTLNNVFGTTFTSWNVEFFGGDIWSASETAGQIPTGSTPTCGTGYSAGTVSSTAVCTLNSADGFDAPRTIPIVGGQLTDGNAFWQAWIRFRQEMVWRYNKDFAKWVTEGVGGTGGVPNSRYFSAQIPQDKLFTNSSGLPNDTGLRLLTGASPHWTADIRPYGGAGVTGYNSNSGGCSTTTQPCTGSQTLGANGPYFHTTRVVSPLVAAFGRWGIVEWNPADPFSNSMDIYRADVNVVRQYRPALLMPFKIPSDHWKVFDPDNATPLPFETALKELIGGRTDGTASENHSGISGSAGWLPRITWTAPTRLLSGTALGASRLNATAHVGGAFRYYSDAALATEITAATSFTVSGFTSETRTLYARFTPTDTDYAAVTTSVSLTVDPLPTMIVSPTAERLFSGIRQPSGVISSMTGGQVVAVSFSNPNNGPWSATASAPWVTITNGSGTGAGLFTIGINTTALRTAIGDSASSANATVTVAATSVAPATSPQVIPIRVTLALPSQDTVPIGQVDTPAQGLGGVQGSLGITGWVVDDRGVSAVKIYRNCLPFEATSLPSPCTTIVDDGRTTQPPQVVFLGDANFVAGARPDIEALFPALPSNNTAGWGFLVLTQMLPNAVAGLSNGGEGNFTLYVMAVDTAGKQTMLGRSFVPSNPGGNDPTSITIVNVSQSSVKPFGAIDTPAQGAVVSGTVNNFGWALTPDSNTAIDGAADISIAQNGASTVFLNAAPAYTANALGQITFNYCRGSVGNPVPAGVYCDDDVSNIFGNSTPRTSGTRSANPTVYRNLDAGRGPIGLFTFDSSLYPTGVYQLQWAVYDNIGRVEGIGSRFITVLNSGDQAARLSPEAQEQTLFSLRNAQARVVGDAVMLRGYAQRTDGVRGRSGFNIQSPYSTLAADEDGVFRVRVELQDRIELDLGGPVDAGYLVANGQMRALPAGSTLRDGSFHWGGVPGYLGDYDLAFVRGGERIDVTVSVVPEIIDEAAQPDVQMHFDEPRVAGPGFGGVGLNLGGWAFDPKTGVGAGIGAVHVWAKRTDVAGLQAPFFVGEATIDGTRPDVAQAFAGAPTTTGFNLNATLAPGTYEITAYVWVTRTGRFEDARTVTITVR